MGNKCIMMQRRHPPTQVFLLILSDQGSSEYYMGVCVQSVLDGSYFLLITLNKGLCLNRTIINAINQGFMLTCLLINGPISFPILAFVFTQSVLSLNPSLRCLIKDINSSELLSKQKAGAFTKLSSK